MLSEQEAKTKQCPFSFAVPGGPWPCVGSECMAWRVGLPAKKRFFVSFREGPEEEWNWDPRPDPNYAQNATVREVVDPPRGHCGLAGRPA
jgi:hypothetical protein